MSEPTSATVGPLGLRPYRCRMSGPAIRRAALGRALPPRRVLSIALASACTALPVACIGAVGDPADGVPGSAAGPDGRDGRVDPDGGLPGDGGAPPAPLDAAAPAPPDAGTGEGSGDAGPPPENGFPIFVAQGHVGRTTVSCDDGRTWVADQSMDDELRCFEDGADCDHHPGAAKGIVYGGNRFFATFGWGPPGSVQRSRDGVSWTSLTEETRFGGIAFGNGTLVLGSRRAARSTDGGETISDGIDTGLAVHNVRRLGFGEVDGGRFLLYGSSGGASDLVLSSDGGASWWHPEDRPADCKSSQTSGGIVSGGGVLLLASGDAQVCRSADGGDTWTVVDLPGSSNAQVVWTGDGFRTWGTGVTFFSPDGETWTEGTTTPANLRIGAVARSPETGTIVAVRGGWRTWYEDQVFYRSTDGGTTFEALPDGAYVGSHPIRFIAFGRGARPAACAD